MVRTSLLLGVMQLVALQLVASQVVVQQHEEEQEEEVLVVNLPGERKGARYSILETQLPQSPLAGIQDIIVQQFKHMVPILGSALDVSVQGIKDDLRQELEDLKTHLSHKIDTRTTRNEVVDNSVMQNNPRFIPPAMTMGANGVLIGKGGMRPNAPTDVLRHNLAMAELRRLGAELQTVITDEISKMRKQFVGTLNEFRAQVDNSTTELRNSLKHEVAKQGEESTNMIKKVFLYNRNQMTLVHNRLSNISDVLATGWSNPSDLGEILPTAQALYGDEDTTKDYGIYNRFSIYNNQRRYGRTTEYPRYKTNRPRGYGQSEYPRYNQRGYGRTTEYPRYKTNRPWGYGQTEYPRYKTNRPRFGFSDRRYGRTTAYPRYNTNRPRYRYESYGSSSGSGEGSGEGSDESSGIILLNGKTFKWYDRSDWTTSRPEDYGSGSGEGSNDARGSWYNPFRRNDRTTQYPRYKYGTEDYGSGSGSDEGSGEGYTEGRGSWYNPFRWNARTTQYPRYKHNTDRPWGYDRTTHKSRYYFDTNRPWITNTHEPTEPTPDDSNLPTDCQDTASMSGKTRIKVSNNVDPQWVWCDQETDGGGWTILLQRHRQSNQLDFRQDWQNYKTGFGDANGEYWMGLEPMSELTKNGEYELRVEMAVGKETATALYDSFRIGGSDSYHSEYRLHVSGYNSSSSAGDGLVYHNGQEFTTYDRDNDQASGGSCSEWSGGGGWWYNYCYYSNPTGVYPPDDLPSGTEVDHLLEWRKWQGYYTYLTSFTMMTRRRRN